MRAVIQRVSNASVVVGDSTISRIGQGLLILIGIENGDDQSDIEWLAGKIARMRIFADADGLMNLGLTDLKQAGILVVSQFTLHASTRKGNRPSFLAAARPDLSKPLYEAFCDHIGGLLNRPVGRGEFGADMQVSLTNDGPVTITIDSKRKE